MGITIHSIDFSSKQGDVLKPVIFVNPEREIATKAVSVNLLLAKALQSVSPKWRAMRMQQVLQDVLRTLPSNPVISDIDAMFNPEYKIDVLQVLIATCKVCPFSLIWPGHYESGVLLYAAPGLEDYKTYKIENYDVSVII